jgi:hypothetical protein
VLNIEENVLSGAVTPKEIPFIGQEDVVGKQNIFVLEAPAALPTPQTLYPVCLQSESV